MADDANAPPQQYDIPDLTNIDPSVAPMLQTRHGVSDTSIESSPDGILRGIDPAVDPKDVLLNKENNQVQAVPNSFDLFAEYRAQTKTAAAYMGYGEHQLARAVAGTQVIDGSKTPDEAVQEFGHQAMDVWKQSNVSPLENATHFPALQQVMGPIMAAVPTMREYAASGATGAAIGATEGAVIGGVMTAGNPLGAALMGIAGGSMGMDVGILDSAYEMGRGALVMDMLDRGVPADVAKPAATIGGLAMGLAQMAGVGAVAGRGIEGIATLFAGDAGQATLKTFGGRILEQAGIGAAFGSLNSFTESTTKAFAGLVSHTNGVVTPAEVAEGMIQNVMAGAVLGGGTGVATEFLKAGISKAVRLKTENHAKFVEQGLPEQVKNQIKEEETVTGVVLSPGARAKRAQEIMFPLKKEEPKEDTSESEPTVKHESRSKAEMKRDEARTDLAKEVARIGDKLDKAQKVLKETVRKIRDLDASIAMLKNSEYESVVVKDLLEQYKGERKTAQNDKVRLEGEVSEWKKAYEDITTNQQQVEKAHQATELGRLMTTVNKTLSPKQSGVPNSRMERGTDIQQVLNRVRHYVKDPKATAQVIESYNTALANGDDISEKMQNEYDAANLVGDIKNKPSKDIRALRNDIELVYQEGRKGRLQQLADQAEHRFKLIAEVTEGLQASEPIESDVNPPSGKTKEDSKVAKVVAPYALNFFGSYLGKWKLALRKAVNRDAIIDKLRVREHVNKVDHQVQENTKLLYDNLAEATGKNKAQINELLRLGAKKKITITANGRESKITINQAMDKLAQLHDPEAREAFVQGNGIDPELVEEQIVRQLGEEDPAYVNLYKGYLKTYKQLYPRLAKEFKAAYGEELPNNPNYSGRLVHDRASLGQEDFELQMRNQRSLYKSGTAAKPVQVKARTGDKSALTYEDIHAKFLRYNRQSEHWIGMREISSNVLGPLIRNPEIRRIIIRKYGQGLYKGMQEDLNDIVYGNSDKKTAAGDFLNEMFLKNTPIFMLSSKPLMFIKHTMAVVTAANKIPVKDLADGLLEFYKNPIKNGKEMVASPEYSTRHAGSDISTAASTQIPEERHTPFIDMLYHWSMSPTVYGIKTTDMSILYAARRYYLSKGMSASEAMTRAGEVLHETQVSAATDITSNLARSQWGQYVTMFQGQITTLAQESVLAWDRALALPSRENFQLAIKTSIISGISTGIFEGVNAAYHYAMAQDDDQRAEALYEGSLGVGVAMIPIINYPLIREAAKYAITKGVDAAFDQKFRTPEASSILGSLGQYATRLTDDYIKALKDPDWAQAHVLRLIIDMHNLAGWKVGSPFKSPLDFLNRYLEHQTSDPLTL
jgi:hypothetical protein